MSDSKSMDDSNPLDDSKSMSDKSMDHDNFMDDDKSVSENDNEMIDTTVPEPMLNAYPLCFHENLLESELDEKECGNGIYVSVEQFKHFNNEDEESLVILKITKGNRSSYAHIIGVHQSDNNMLIMPTWMCNFIGTDCGDNVTVKKYTDSRIGLNIRIQPHTSGYAKLPDPVTALRDAFENYTILLSGMEIPLRIAGQNTIVNIIDTHHEGPVCIRGVELSVEIDTPLDFVEDVVSEHKDKKARTLGELNNSICEPFVEDETVGFDSLLPMPVPVDEKRFPGKGNVLGRK